MRETQRGMQGREAHLHLGVFERNASTRDGVPSHMPGAVAWERPGAGCSLRSPSASSANLRHLEKNHVDRIVTAGGCRRGLTARRGTAPPSNSQYLEYSKSEQGDAQQHRRRCQRSCCCSRACFPTAWSCSGSRCQRGCSAAPRLAPRSAWRWPTMLPSTLSRTHPAAGWPRCLRSQPARSPGR